MPTAPFDAALVEQHSGIRVVGDIMLLIVVETMFALVLWSSRREAADFELAALLWGFVARESPSVS